MREERVDWEREGEGENRDKREKLTLYLPVTAKPAMSLSAS